MAQHNLSAGLYRLAMVDRALELTEDAKTKLDESETRVLLSLKLNPNNAEAHVTYGNLLLARGKTDEALKEYTMAAELKPEMPDGWRGQGVALTVQKKLDDAEAMFFVELHDGDAVVDEAEDEGSEDGAEGGAAAAEEAGAADDGGGDDGEFIAGAGAGLGGVEASDGDECGDACEEADDGVGAEFDEGDIDAAEARLLRCRRPQADIRPGASS